MKNANRTQSATSLPRAPRDDASARSRRYLIMMAIRMVCFILMVVITPYGWQTWLLGAAAIFLPYVAVVSANNGDGPPPALSENPERMLDAAPSRPAQPADASATVIRIAESPEQAPRADPSPPNADERDV